MRSRQRELIEESGELATVEQFRGLGEIRGHHAILFQLLAHAAESSQRLLRALARLEWREEVQRLGSGKGLDRENTCRVLYNSLKLDRRGHAHGDVIFFVSRCRNRIH